MSHHFSDLHNLLPHQLTIPPLGEKGTLTIYNLRSGIMAKHSEGMTYRIMEEDWAFARMLRGAFPDAPWQSALYTELNVYFRCSLAYAAALLRHMEHVEATKQRSRSRARLQRKSQPHE
ncbi:MAG: hypothetical protein ACQCXQ_00580 [Verrucomicrobiales bacterium]|nr:hypothetical protein [Verrucomicrobiota bacterium JB025]